MSLSDEGQSVIFGEKCNEVFYAEEKVQKAIKELKEEFDKGDFNLELAINKIFGDKLCVNDNKEEQK